MINIPSHISNVYLPHSSKMALHLSSLQIKITAIAVLVLSCLITAVYLLRHHIAKWIKDKAKPIVTTLDQGKTFLYLKKEAIKRVSYIDKEIYRKAVENLPICCVDIFLYDPVNKSYLLVQRKDPPAKDAWWVPGGRLEKGESFFDCAERKCLKEVGLKVTPRKILGSGATLFPDSMWNTQTHTVNVFVLAVLNEGQSKPKLDSTSEKWRWEKIQSIPEDPYVGAIQKKALKAINHLKL